MIMGNFSTPYNLVPRAFPLKVGKALRTRLLLMMFIIDRFKLAIVVFVLPGVS